MDSLPDIVKCSSCSQIEALTCTFFASLLITSFFFFFFMETIQVPIQVNRHVAYSDGMRVVEPAKTAGQHLPSDGLLFQELDR